MHDGALVFVSGKTVVFDELGRQSAKCAYGPCAKANGLRDEKAVSLLFTQSEVNRITLVIWGYYSRG